ncbi:MAG: DUF933 domain-containing protein [Desulfovibrionaceae bacterium]
MKTAIMGFAGSGKTDLFAALAGEKAAQAGNRAMVKVPEPRLDPLVTLYNARKVTYSEIEYLDIPGGGSKSGGLGERVLSEVRAHDCLLVVLDAFSGMSDPEAQRQAVQADFLVSDLAVVEKRLERLAADKKKNAAGYNAQEDQLLHAAQAVLESERPLRAEPELCRTPELRGFCFLSAKPVLWAWNVAETKMDDFTPPADAPGEIHIAVSARLERELADIADPEERAAFFADLGLTESALDRVITRTYRLLGLISFFTAGEKEVRAWPVRRGALAPEAAGVIHSDFEKGFIRAEVLGYDDFLSAGSVKKARELGMMRLEGKEYEVKDADIVEFRFNV